MLHNVGVSSLRKWIAAYQAHGIAGIRVRRRELYDVEFKLAVLERVRDEGLSFRQAAALFNIRNFNIIDLWQRAYESDGMAGVVPYQVTRHETMTKEIIPHSTLQPCDDATRTRQELVDELNNLRLESLAFDSLFKSLCATAQLVTAEQKQVLAPFAFVSQLAGTVQAIELFLRRLDPARAKQFNYWRVNPWRGIFADLQQMRLASPDCQVCTDSNYQLIANDLWRVTEQCAVDTAS